MQPSIYKHPYYIPHHKKKHKTDTIQTWGTILLLQNSAHGSVSRKSTWYLRRFLGLDLPRAVGFAWPRFRKFAGENLREVVARDVDASMIHRLFFCVSILFMNCLNAIDVCYLDSLFAFILGVFALFDCHFSSFVSSFLVFHISPHHHRLVMSCCV